jgi:hypothetical protein
VYLLHFFKWCFLLPSIYRAGKDLESDEPVTIFNLKSKMEQLDFCLILRIGELKVLRWDDIKGDYIYVHAFMNEKKEIIPYCKGHTEAGMHYLPLTYACKRILKEIKRVNPDSE